MTPNEVKPNVMIRPPGERYVLHTSTHAPACEDSLTVSKQRLCCLVNPATIEGLDNFGDNCWCVYCKQTICHECVDKYISVDEYYHHKECLEVCPHTIEFHPSLAQEGNYDEGV